MFEEWILKLFIPHNIKYIIKKIYYQIKIYYNNHYLTINCQNILNEYLKNKNNKKNIKNNIDEFLLIISLQIILRQILYILDKNCKIKFKSSYITNFNCYILINNLLLDNYIFNNGFSTDIIIINKQYYHLWLQNINEEFEYILNNEEFYQKYYIYTEHMKELIYKLYHCYYILTDRFDNILNKNN